MRILTNSLESAPDLAAQAGYMHYRVPLLRQGAQLFEVRARLESVRGSGQSRKISRYGNYALHAKLMVFDRSSLYVGSMNFDQRSIRLNTEVGLIIQSRELAEQTARRFEAMTQPQSSYSVTLQQAHPRAKPRLSWSTVEADHPVSPSSLPAAPGRDSKCACCLCCHWTVSYESGDWKISVSSLRVSSIWARSRRPVSWPSSSAHAL